MTVLVKCLLLVIVGLLLLVGNFVWSKGGETIVGNRLTLNAFNGDNTDWMVSNAYQSMQNSTLFSVIFFFGFAALLFVPWSKFKKGTAAAVTAGLVFVSFGMTGCEPYDTPEFVEVKSSETAFLVSLDGDTKANQEKFASEEFLLANKISQKRVQIPHRWVKLGRGPYNGQYLATMRLITVDRTPVTREWNPDQKKDTAIWVESGDSVGFSMGWSVTAYIKEEDAAKFLYWYPSGSLETVMDKEIRARVQQSCALFTAKFKLDDLRLKKNELAKEVTADVTAFFAPRGITVTTVGMFGGMTYENAKIQEAIDLTFINQQEKVNADSLLTAQKAKNDRITSEADAFAQAARTKARGEAEGNLLKSTAEADGIKAISRAIAESNNNPQLVSLKTLEVEKDRIGKWDGKFPSMIVGSGANTWVGLQPVNAASSASTNPPK